MSERLVILGFAVRIALFLLLAGMTAFIGAFVIGALRTPQLIVFEALAHSNVEIFVMDVERRLMWNLTQHPAADTTPFWVFNGTAIAFYSTRSAVTTIYLMDVDGANVRRAVVNEELLAVQAAYFGGRSPDGTRYVYPFYRGSNLDIYLEIADSGVISRLTTTINNESELSWSPDGTRIVFSSQDPTNGHVNICTITADGGDLRCLTDNQSIEGYWSPSYSPDGAWITYRINNDLYMMDASGQHSQRLTVCRCVIGQATWYPTGE